jgi:hypothetical protein
MLSEHLINALFKNYVFFYIGAGEIFSLTALIAAES